MRMKRRDRGAFATSLVAHALLVAGVVWYVRKHPMKPVADPTVGTIEIEFDLAPIVHPALAAREQPRSSELEVLEPVRAMPPIATNTAVDSGERSAHARSIDPVVPAPTTASEPSGPNAPPSAFVGWDPRAANGSRRATNAPLQGTDILAGADDAADRAARSGALAGPAPSGQTDHGDVNTSRANDSQVREASAGYLRRLVEDAAPSNIPGALPYYRRVAREATRVFHPPYVPTPTIGETVLNTFVAPTSTSMDATRRSLGPLAEGRAGRAAELLQYNHPNSPLLQPANTMAARAAATARTTSVEIEVDQDASGRIIATRLLTHSGVSGFDRDAMRAIQDAVRGIDPPAMTGTWRSHWSFQVVTSRDPFVSALPSMPGESPTIGVAGEVEFDEVTREAEFHAPGMAHSRRRVRLMSSRVVDATSTNTASAPPAH